MSHRKNPIPTPVSSPPTPLPEDGVEVCHCERSVAISFAVPNPGAHRRVFNLDVRLRRPYSPVGEGQRG